MNPRRKGPLIKEKGRSRGKEEKKGLERGRKRDNLKVQAGRKGCAIIFLKKKGGPLLII